MTNQTYSEKMRRVVGDNISHLRAQAGKTREEFAAEVPTTRGVIYEFETQAKSPSLEMLDRIARAFSRLLNEPITAADLLTERKTRKRELAQR